MARPYEESRCVHLNLLKKFSRTNVPPEDTEISTDSEDDGATEEKTPAPILTDCVTDDARLDGEPQFQNLDEEDDQQQREVDRDAQIEGHGEQEPPFVRDEKMIAEHGLRRRPRRRPRRRVDPDFDYY